MKKLSKKVLSKSFWRWFYGNLTCFSHEHMQTFGYMWSMLPIVQELYDSKDEQAEKLKTYYPFFNTEPQIGSIVVGITAGLEEARANGAEEIDDEMINGIRAGLMGPLAGIGDSLIVGTYIPVLLGIALGLSEGGSLIGPLFYIIVWNITSILFQKWIYGKGYELGGSAVEVIVGEQATALRESVIVMGQVIVGAMAGTWVSITTAVQLHTIVLVTATCMYVTLKKPNSIIRISLPGLRGRRGDLRPRRLRPGGRHGRRHLRRQDHEGSGPHSRRL